jgi:hypothetical protein
MPLIMLLALAAALQAKPAAPAGDEPGPYLRAYGGDWAAPGFDFNATRVDGKRRIEGKDVEIGGLEAGIELGRTCFSFVGFERGESDGLSLDTASVGAGVDLEIGESGGWRVRLSPYAAAMAGRLEVDASGFGRFDTGYGMRAGIDLGLPLAAGLSLGAFVEGRAMRYDYRETVVEGDDKILALGAAAGLSVSLRF